MTTGEFKKLIRRKGCTFVSHGGKHDLWMNSKNGKTTRIGRHDGKELPAGTVDSMLKDLGLK